MEENEMEKKPEEKKNEKKQELSDEEVNQVAGGAYSYEDITIDEKQKEIEELKQSLKRGMKSWKA